MEKIQDYKGTNVLFVGNLSGTSTSVHYLTNLIKLGCTVYPFDPLIFETRHLIDRLTLAVGKRPPPRNLKRASEKIVSLCRDNPFDIVFVMNEYFVGRETLYEIRRVSRRSPILIFHTHDNSFSDGILKPTDFNAYMSAFDFVFTTKSFNVKRYQDLGQPNSFFLPSCYESTIHHPVPDSKSAFGSRRFPITFVGNYDHSRRKPIAHLGWKNVHIWGERWKRCPEAKFHPENVRTQGAYYLRYADVISHSLISLGLLREEASDLHTQRTFEIPACGTLQIAPRNDEILGLFKEDQEIVCFGDVTELVEKCEYYLRKDSPREKIARRGYERVQRDGHSYDNRCRSILEIVFEHMRSKLSPRALVGGTR